MLDAQLAVRVGVASGGEVHFDAGVLLTHRCNVFAGLCVDHLAHHEACRGCLVGHLLLLVLDDQVLGAGTGRIHVIVRLLLTAVLTQ